MIDRHLDPYTYPLEPWWFTRPDSIHGLSHTRRVLIHAVALAEPAGLDAFEFEALIHAACWHDIARTHDGWERKHGPNSAARIKALGLARDLAPEVSEPLFFAVRWHSTDDDLAVKAAERSRPLARRVASATPEKTSALTAVESKPDPRSADTPRQDSRLRVLWTLKDADGLDRVRIHDLDVARLRSDAARAREAEAWRLLEELP